ncbi:MAG TPA: DUF2934 domain-containing protein [Terriglobales bacterium]|jgi:hypothetical protein
MPVQESCATESSLEPTLELIRKRALAFFQERGGEPGHDLEDWLKAEAEVVGHKTNEPEPELVMFSFTSTKRPGAGSGKSDD